jgi:tellurite resistance protein TerC
MMRRRLRVTEGFEGQKFFVRRQGLLFATPLFMVLVLIEFSDLIFAVDSIPAIFAITTDPFVVYTSNVFAILGLRALYFALAGVVDRFHYLKYGLSRVLLLIGVKMILNGAYGEKVIPTEIALVATAVLIGGSILLSILRPRPEVDARGLPMPTGWIPGAFGGQDWENESARKS